MIRLDVVVDPDAAREQARDILRGERFRDDAPARPLRGVLEWIGDRLRDAWDGVRAVLEVLPGPLWLAIATVCVAFVAALLILTIRRRRGGVVTVTPTGRARGPAARPTDLERAADAAERDGDLARAVRLRFRAGIRRLGDDGRIDARPSVTNGSIARVLQSVDFDLVAGDFDEIVYGGRDATARDVETARTRWPRVLDRSRR